MTLSEYVSYIEMEVEPKNICCHTKRIFLKNGVFPVIFKSKKGGCFYLQKYIRILK